MPGRQESKRRISYLKVLTVISLNGLKDLLSSAEGGGEEEDKEEEEEVKGGRGQKKE